MTNISDFVIFLLWNEAEVLTSTVGMKDENKGRQVQKAKVCLISLSM